MSKTNSLQSISVEYSQTGSSKVSNELGMRIMQERAYEKRGEQYLLIKSPPASGKSRALMFIALDKLKNQGLKQAIVVVPERSIGASFQNEKLSQFGFFYDWEINPKWNLCSAPLTDGSKVKAVKSFIESEEEVLLITHATFRFAADKYGIEIFDKRLIAIDEFHHTSANPDNKLGKHLTEIIARNSSHIIAMTGSYFRGDSEPVLMPEDEVKFKNVTYTYYEQLNGYEFLKQLDIGYFFYSGNYCDDILKVLNPKEKTIIHIPSVNSKESTKDKIKEVEHIMESLGEWQETDPETGFHLIKREDGEIIKIADLVDDEPSKRDRIISALKSSNQNKDKDYIDIIIALGMAKEGFDWIWCEHALTVGYRSSLTEIVQIIGRATRDAPGKTKTRFTNLIAEPDAAEQTVAEAVNDTLKAIAASLLMEQVLAPNFNFRPKKQDNQPLEGFDYGKDGYDPNGENVGFNKETGQFEIEIRGISDPKTKECQRICEEDLNEIVAAFVQEKSISEKGLFDNKIVPEELNQIFMAKIIKEKYPDLDQEDQETLRQRAVANLNLIQKSKEFSNKQNSSNNEELNANTALIDGVRKFVTDVRDLNIDLIDRINPFSEAYSILAKTMSENSLKELHSIISSKRISMSLDDARELSFRALKFKKERGRLPSLTSSDPWEKRIAEGVAYLKRSVERN